MMTFLRASLLLLCLPAVMCQAQQKVADGMRRCRDSKAEPINQCLMKEVMLLRPYLREGLPELGLPKMEPLLIDNIKFRQSEPPVTVEAEFRNLAVSGITTFELKYFDMDPGVNPKVNVGLVIPSLTVRGQYTIGGNVFLLPIEGNGDFTLLLDGIIAEGKGDLIRTGDKVVLKNLKTAFKIKSLKSKLQNLFNGNQLLSDTIHHFLNENGQLVLDAIRPGITEQLDIFIAQIFNSMFNVLPADVFEIFDNNKTVRKIRAAESYP